MNEIRCLAMDVDGVMTDGLLWYGDRGEPRRGFHIHDGLAIQWFARLGGIPVILTGKRSNAVAARAEDLGIQHIVQGSRDKLSDLRAVLSEIGVDLAETAMIGDDLPDIPVMAACGYPIAVANAVEAVRATARFVTTRQGGDGAVREAIEHLMNKTGSWDRVYAHFGVTDRRRLSR